MNMLQVKTDFYSVPAFILFKYRLKTTVQVISVTDLLSLRPSTLPGMLPVHPAGAAARHRPPAGRGGEGKGGGGRAGGPAVATTSPLAAAQQFALPPDGGQGRAVRGGGRGEEGQRRGVHRGQLLLPHHRRIHRRQGTRAEERRGEGLLLQSS